MHTNHALQFFFIRILAICMPYFFAIVLWHYCVHLLLFNQCNWQIVASWLLLSQIPFVFLSFVLQSSISITFHIAMVQPKIGSFFHCHRIIVESVDQPHSNQIRLKFWEGSTMKSRNLSRFFSGHSAIGWQFGSVCALWSGGIACTKCCLFDWFSFDVCVGVCDWWQSNPYQRLNSLHVDVCFGSHILYSNVIVTAGHINCMPFLSWFN